MAICEVCGVEQYPANTVVRYDEAGHRHFYCSIFHADTPQQRILMTKASKEPITKEEAVPEEQMSVEEVARAVELEAAETSPLPEDKSLLAKPAPKRRGRPPGTKNKTKVAKEDRREAQEPQERVLSAPDGE